MFIYSYINTIIELLHAFRYIYTYTNAYILCNTYYVLHIYIYIYIIYIIYIYIILKIKLYYYFIIFYFYPNEYYDI